MHLNKGALGPGARMTLVITMIKYNQIRDIQSIEIRVLNYKNRVCQYTMVYVFGDLYWPYQGGNCAFVVGICIINKT